MISERVRGKLEETLEKIQNNFLDAYVNELLKECLIHIGEFSKKDLWRNFPKQSSGKFSKDSFKNTSVDFFKWMFFLENISRVFLRKSSGDSSKNFFSNLALYKFYRRILQKFLRAFLEIIPRSRSKIFLRVAMAPPEMLLRVPQKNLFRIHPEILPGTLPNRFLRYFFQKIFSKEFYMIFPKTPP